MSKETKNTAEAELTIFVDNLVAEKNFDVQPEVLAQIKEDLFGRAEDIINATILAGTPPEKLEELDQLLEKGDKAGVEEFCNINIPDLQNKIAAALHQFRNTYLGIQ